MIVLARKNGRLGNRLALTAHFAAWSDTYGICVWNPTLDEYADFFENWRNDLWGRVPPRSSWIPAFPALRHAFYLFVKTIAYVLRRFWPCGPFHEVIDIGITTEFNLADPAFLKRARRKIVFCIGWLFRDEVSILKRNEMLRALFRPVERYRLEADQVVEEAHLDTDVLVGVHIRHGDYKTFLGGRYYYTLEQYRAFMAQMQQVMSGKRVTFLVCSDEALRLEVFNGLRIRPGPGHMISDMAALARCDYIIGPPSTFSYWASFVGVCPLLHMLSADQRVDLDDFIVANLGDRFGEDVA